MLYCLKVSLECTHQFTGRPEKLSWEELGKGICHRSDLKRTNRLLQQRRVRTSVGPSTSPADGSECRGPSYFQPAPH